MSKAAPAQGFLLLMVKGYVWGTLASAFVLHIAVAIIAPGGAGTMFVLFDPVILFLLVFVLAIIGSVLFPAAAFASWPFRRLVIDRPTLGLICACGVGVAIGAVGTATVFQIGPGDFWSGPLVGLVYGAVWFFIVRSHRQAQEA